VSGVVALFDRDGGVAVGERLTRMLEAIDHRGPDGSGVWDAPDAGLGHQHLRTTPESTATDQPTRDGDCVVAADLRLDNRDELLDALQFSDPPDRVADCDLVLAAYRKWGRECPSKLYGAFAFVVWDGDQLFCARDHFGVKPLYYHRSPELFAVASEPKALLTLPQVDGRVDRVAVGDLLLHTFADTENSYFESISRLPPAHAMRVDAETTEQWQYWSLDPTRTVTLDSDAAYERRFRELFEQAVSCRLRGSGAVGSDLSGGLDSTAVTLMAREVLPDAEPLHTFSNTFDEAPSSDEREFFGTVTDRAGLVSHCVSLDETGALVDSDEVLEYLDHPPHNTMHFAKWERLKQLDAADVSVHLTGEMGDSAVGYGFGALPQWLRTGRWLRLCRELRAMGDVVGASPVTLFRENALDPLVPSGLERWYQSLRGEPVLAEAANPTLRESFVERYGLQDRLRAHRSDGSVLRRSGRRWQHRSLTSGRITATLETIDMLHAPFGIEPRHPFTDVRLVEYALAIPPTQQLKDGYTRSVMRRALGDLLPEPIQWRPWKTMVGEAFRNALANEDEALRRVVQNPGPLREFLDEAELRGAYDGFTETRDARDARSLWKALALGAWLDARGDTDRPSAPRIEPDRQ